MAKRGGSVSSVRRVSSSVFFSLFFASLAYISLAISAVFIWVGFDRDGWEVLGSSAFWTVINSFWIGAILLFYFSEKLK